MNLPVDVLDKIKNHWRTNVSTTYRVLFDCLAVLLLIAFILFVFFINQCTSWIEHHHKAFEFLSLFTSFAFAAIGFVFSVRTIEDGKRQEEEIGSQRLKLEQTTKHLERISESMSTCYVDSFPKSLNRITRLINETEKTLIIVADCADYGSFSDPEGHKKIMETIAEIHERAKIEIRICGQPQLISRSSEFWEDWQNSEYDPAAWDRLCNNQDFKKRLQLFCQVNNRTDFDQVKCLRQEFKRIMQDKHDQVVRDLTNDFKVQVRTLANLEYMPGIFFWMRDNKEAVFLLSHTGAGTQGIAFFTRDWPIIKILSDTWTTIERMENAGKLHISAFNRKSNVDNFMKVFPFVKRELVDDLIHASGQAPPEDNLPDC